MPSKEEIAKERGTKRELISVKFRQAVSMYNPGEVAGFPLERASKLVAAGAAVYVDTARQENYERAMMAADVQMSMVTQPGKPVEEVLFERTLAAMDEPMRALVADWLISGVTQTEAVERAQQGMSPQPKITTPGMTGDPSKLSKQDQADLEAMELQRKREQLALAAGGGEAPQAVAAPVPVAEPVETPDGMPAQDVDEDARSVATP